MDNFLQLHDINKLIIQYLTLGDMLCCSHVNKHFHNFFKDHIAEKREIFKDNENMLIWASKNNDLSLLKYSNFCKTISTNMLNKCFMLSCKNGHLDVAQWLYSLGNVNIRANNDEAFYLGCNNGHLEVAKWLFSLGDVNIYACNDYVFRVSCQYGRIEIAQWLFSLGNIDIHVYNDHAFRLSCQNGHIEIAKWLFSLGNVNIRVYNDYAFLWSCLNSRLDVAEWLCTLYSGYHIEIIDNKIKFTIN